MIPSDVVEIIPDVLRHRLVLSYDALADEIDAQQVITRILQTVGLPQVASQPVGGPPPRQNGQPPVPNGQRALPGTAPAQYGRARAALPAEPTAAPVADGRG